MVQFTLAKIHHLISVLLWRWAEGSKTQQSASPGHYFCVEMTNTHLALWLWPTSCEVSCCCARQNGICGQHGSYSASLKCQSLLLPQLLTSQLNPLPSAWCKALPAILLQQGQSQGWRVLRWGWGPQHPPTKGEEGTACLVSCSLVQTWPEISRFAHFHEFFAFASCAVERSTDPSVPGSWGAGQ